MPHVSASSNSTHTPPRRVSFALFSGLCRRMRRERYTVSMPHSSTVSQIGLGAMSVMGRLAISSGSGDSRAGRERFLLKAQLLKNAISMPAPMKKAVVSCKKGG